MKKIENDLFLQQDSVFGTDSHTTMINGLGVLGWGVGGMEEDIRCYQNDGILPMILKERSVFD